MRLRPDESGTVDTLAVCIEQHALKPEDGTTEQSLMLRYGIRQMAHL
jgi:hypothetical protein